MADSLVVSWEHFSKMLAEGLLAGRQFIFKGIGDRVALRLAPTAPAAQEVSP